MKKKLLCSAMFSVLTLSIMSFAKSQFAWTSTCGVKHVTTFPDGWTYNQMSDWIASANHAECGVKPSVNLNLN